jgi:hypothetical protein
VSLSAPHGPTTSTRPAGCTSYRSANFLTRR